MGFDEVSNQLWQERGILELLLFKLEEEHLVLASGRHAWLARTTAEVEYVVEILKSADLARAVAVSALAEELDLDPAPTLAELAEAAPEPWESILTWHRDALLTAFAQVDQVSARNREILARGIAATTGALTYLGEQAQGAYDATGARAPARVSPRLVNSAL